MMIAVDFDGTCVTHEFPQIGRDVGAESVLRKLVGNGHKLILFTMRSDDPPKRMVLTDAVNWFKERGIPLFGINTNPEQKQWTSSPKAYAQIYIDDAALGIPLKDGVNGERPYVDWEKVEDVLIKEGLI